MVGAQLAGAGGVGLLDQVDLGLFQTHGGLVSLFDEPLQGLGVGGDPDVLDRGAEELADAVVVEKAAGDAGEQDGAGRQPVCLVGGEEVGLADVDEVDAFARYHKQDEAEVAPGHQGVGVVLVGVDDVADGQEIQLAESAAAGAVEREEDGPGEAAAGEADDGQDLEEAEEEETIDGAVVEDEGVWDLEEGDDPLDEALGQLRAQFPSFCWVCLCQLEKRRGKGEGRDS